MSSIHEIAEELSRSGSISTPRAELLFDRPGRYSSECGVVNSTDLVSDIRNSLVRNQRNIGNGAGSAFTPIAKRVHSDNQTPSPYIQKSLRFDSSTESSPFMSRNTSSIMDDLEIVPVDTNHDFVVLDVEINGIRSLTLVMPSAKQRIREGVHHSEEPGRGQFHDGGFCDQQKRQKSVRHQTQQRKSPQNDRPPPLSQRSPDVRRSSRLSPPRPILQMLARRLYFSLSFPFFNLLAFMYILMECCARGNLTVSFSLSLTHIQSFLARQSSISEPFIWVLLHTVLQALTFLHSHRVVHLDLKPDNLLFDDLGRLRIGDFGCAAHFDELSVFSDRRYMALEGLEDRITPNRDLFSLGLIAYQLMSHEDLPVSGERWTALRQENGIPSVAGYSSRLNRMVRNMTAPTNGRSAAEFLEEVPGNVGALESEVRSMIRSTCPSVVETSKVPRKKSLRIKTESTDLGDMLEERSNMTTPVDVIQSSYSAMFKF
ncbi:uncharacterized protein [Blastocystis hominis]|uniref:Protein kinase domain-containing protein n=1 Tax=Blastocystis hominis TaxID=12968 RepID=D8LZP6_BLAHO|nr:uncharacterized protein [Blastocystis hominis]CBK21285.2 unnamed protein product [Blastocystis hominis]|eukprot:XP_012895333.1 uncharacterized protein [Blastocystis hominis]